MPPQMQERIVCVISASKEYRVPANLLLAIAEQEGGKPGLWVKNTNGTHDVGAMQFNTAYLRELKVYNINANDVAASGCYPYLLAAWRVKRHLEYDKGDIWTRAANYHSKTPKYNIRYRNNLIKKATKWADWLENNYQNISTIQENLNQISIHYNHVSNQAVKFEYKPRTISIKK